MGYKSDVRIITSKDGFEILKEFVKKYLKEHNEDYNLLEKCDIKQEGKEQYYFGWNYIKWYENDYKDVDAIMEGLNYLGEKEYQIEFFVLRGRRTEGLADTKPRTLLFFSFLLSSPI